MVHRILLIAGVAVVAVGLVFALVPFVNGPSLVLTPDRPYAAFNATAPISITGAWTIAVDWSSNLPVSLLVVLCHSVNLNAESFSTVCPGAAVSVLNGTSGSPSFPVPLGGALLVGIVSNTTAGLRVSVELKLTEAVLGAVLVIGGAAVAVAGVLPFRRRSAPKTSGPAPVGPQP